MSLLAPEVSFVELEIPLFSLLGTNLPLGIVSGDWDSGNLDVATANRNSNDLSVGLGNGSGGFAFSRGPSLSGPVSIAKGLFNGDTFPDLVTANHLTNPVSVLLNNQVGGFTLERNVAVGQVPAGVGTGDFNGDGNLDIATADAQDKFLRVNFQTGVVETPPGRISVLLGDGTGNFLPATSYPTGGFLPNHLAVGDFDSDGNLDVAVAHRAFRPDNGVVSTVGVLFGDGAGGFGPALTLHTGPQARSIITADLDGNGALDIATANVGRSVSVFLGDGFRNFSPIHSQSGTGTGTPMSLLSGDFNGDGDLDLAVASMNFTGIVVGDGTGGFVAAASFPGTNIGLGSGVAGAS